MLINTPIIRIIFIIAQDKCKKCPRGVHRNGVNFCCDHICTKAKCNNERKDNSSTCGQH